MWYRTLTANNKNLRLVLAQVKEQLDLILKGDTQKIAIIKEAVPEPKYQPAAAYFLAQGADPGGLTECFRQLGELDSKNKVQGIQASKKGVTFNNQSYTDWLKFSEAVHGLFSANDDFRPSTKGAETDIKPTTTGNNITVTRAKTPADAAQLGIGTSWCIADPKQGMFNSYRNAEEATFYFLVDKNQPEDSPLRRTVVNMTSDGPQITDLNNTSGIIAKFGDDANGYFEYLAGQGVDINHLQNDPLSPEEVALNNELEEARDSPDRYKEFLSMPSATKSAFIGRAYKLNPDEIRFIADNNLDGLMNQYLNIGHPMSEQEFSPISKKRGWVDTYARKRKQYLEVYSKDMTTLDAQLVPDIYALHKDEFEEKKRQYDEGELDFSLLPIFYRDNLDIASKAWDDGKAQFYYLPEAMKNDIGIARMALDSGQVGFRQLPGAMQNDIEFCRMAFESGKIRLDYLPEALKNDIDIVRMAWDRGEVKFWQLPDALQSDADFSLRALESRKVGFRELPAALQNDVDFALKVWRNKIISFYQLPEALRKDASIALESWESGELKYSYLPSELKNDAELTLKGWEQGRVHYTELPESISGDVQFALKAWEQGKVDYKYLPAALKINPKIGLQALANNNISYYNLPPALKNDVDFSRAAWDMGKVISYNQLPEALQNDLDFARRLLKSGESIWGMPYNLVNMLNSQLSLPSQQPQQVAKHVIPTQNSVEEPRD